MGTSDINDSRKNNVPRGQFPNDLLTPRELSLTTEVRTPEASGTVTIPDPSDTLRDPVVERIMRQLVVITGRLLANRSTEVCQDPG